MGTDALCEHDLAQISVTVFGLAYVLVYALVFVSFFNLFECWNRRDVEIIDMHGWCFSVPSPPFHLKPPIRSVHTQPTIQAHVLYVMIRWPSRLKTEKCRNHKRKNGGKRPSISRISSDNQLANRETRHLPQIDDLQNSFAKTISGARPENNGDEKTKRRSTNIFAMPESRKGGRHNIVSNWELQLEEEERRGERTIRRDKSGWESEGIKRRNLLEKSGGRRKESGGERENGRERRR
ncbi:hypothetical protein L484_002863 [Morus notabilis]|uniref:Uncharacterized protein n=1 Tax=Morus notabilis TaxID=981085 RepID=W9RD70_9ROSA|nr:hypothetical protein L484_002863 [Morus notabilis]